MNKYHRRAKQFIGTLNDIGEHCESGQTILDFGCGAGNLVEAFQHAGWNAFGCDLAFKEGPHVDRLSSLGAIRRIDPENYQLPFEDNTFDLVVSDQVFEHVQNYDSAISEIVRVLKPDGATLHVFPPRYKPIEPHVHVPLATVWQNYPWLLAWALLGIRKENQRGIAAREVARSNYQYLTSSTNYLSKCDIRKAFARQFSKVRFCEEELAQQLADGRYRVFGSIPFGVFPKMVSAFHTRAVYAAGPGRAI